MATIKTENETVGTRAKRRKLCETEKDDSTLYHNKNMTESYRGTLETPEESSSEREGCKGYLPTSPSYIVDKNYKCYRENYKETSNVRCNNNSEKIYKSKSQIISDNPEETNMQQSYNRNFLQHKEGICAAKQNMKSSRNSSSTSPLKETSMKNKNKKLSLDQITLNSQLERYAGMPSCKFEKQEDFSLTKFNKNQFDKNENSKNINEIKGNMYTRSKSKMNETSNDDDSSERNNSMIDSMSPIKSKGKGTSIYKNSDSEEDFCDSSEESNHSIRENMTDIPSLSKPSFKTIKNKNHYEFFIENDSCDAKENDLPDKSKVKSKIISKSHNRKSKSNSQKAKSNHKLDTSGSNCNSDDSIINATQVLRSSSRIAQQEENKLEPKSIAKSSAKRKSESSEAESATSGLSPISLVGKPKNTKVVATSSKIQTPKKRNSRRIAQKDSKTPEPKQNQTPLSKSKKPRAKSLRTPSLSTMNEDLGLSWDEHQTPVRRFSLRLKKTESQSGTPRSATSIKHIGNTPQSSKRKKLLDLGKENKLVLESGGESDSNDSIANNFTPTKQRDRKSVRNISTKRMLKKLDINDTDSCDDSENNSSPVKRRSNETSRISSPRRTPRKLAGKKSDQARINKTTPKKTSQKKPLK